MRRAASDIAVGIVAAALSTGTVRAVPPAVLSRPAMVSDLALHGLMLAVVRAGPRLVAVGERGTVLLSDEGGQSWRQARQVPVSVTLTAVCFISPAEGWAVGHLGVILHSLDGGESWTMQLDGSRAAALVRRQADAMPDGPAKRKAIANARQLVADGPDKPFLDVTADASGAVIAIGADGIAVRSADGGKSWVSAVDAFPDPRGLHLYAIAQVAGSGYVAGEQGLLLVSSGGAYLPVKTPYDGSFFGVVVVHDAVLAYGLRGHLLRSQDHGAHWIDIPTGQQGALNCALVLRDGRVLLGSQSGQLIISSDGGRSFRALGGLARGPIAALAETPGALVVAGPGGMVRLDAQRLGEAS